ncbi:Type II secretion system protein E [Vibrio nigripulchritudo FTn2]|uniref:CpaF family protein n=1 Tax=Vibrio nigripulchritudo TaxID=28173 RepID=UPI0003B235D1|nr:ATPase, T2SS/T4P/T4SS family [Vibrio nigripulchritudo]CCN39741.1 Type II secretion system protein E [Vibrio nigripulchritudo FTn2]
MTPSTTNETIFGEVPSENWMPWLQVQEDFKPLVDLYQMRGVTEIFVDRFDSVSIEINGVIEKVENRFDNEKHFQSFLSQVAVALHQQFDSEHPILDARMPDCSRICCTLPNVTPQGATMTMRIAPKTTLTAEQLVKFGALTEEMLSYLRAAVDDKKNLIVSGNTGSGKTTLLRALAKYIPERERIVTCEDTQELYLDWLPHLVSMEAPNRKGSRVEMKNLIEASLRMRPDRIWVGEIRKASAADAYLQAINTGHSGCATTLHANTCVDAVKRLQYLIASQGAISYDLAYQQITGNVDVFVQASRSATYGRKITEIVEVKSGKLQPVFTYNGSTFTRVS